MTRGRDSRHAYIIVEDNQNALDVLTQAITRNWIDQPAMARQAQLDPDHSRRLPGRGGEDEFDRLERHACRLIDDRRTRAREAERSMSRALDR